MSPDLAIRPAATVLLLKDDGAGLHVLLVRRSARSPFMPDAMVFPGGRVDANDASVPLVPSVGWNQEILRSPSSGDSLPVSAWYVAALRECVEEVGLLPTLDPTGTPTACAVSRTQRRAVEAGEITLLDALGIAALDPAAMVYVARWITPAFESRRYDTRFFVAHVPGAPEAIADEHETHHATWWRPADVLAAATANALVLAPPTWHMLLRLQAFQRATDVMAWARTTRPAAVHPVVSQQGTRIRLELGVDPFDEAGPPDSTAWEVRDGGRFGIWEDAE